MSDFVNTIDILGDDAVMDSIITRTIESYFDNNVTRIGKGAFYQCNNLTDVNTPSATTIEDNAFYECKKLRSASFASANRIGSSAFHTCLVLSEVAAPLVTYIGGSAFYGCEQLTTVTFSTVVTSLEGSAFYKCSNLKKADFAGLVKINASVFNQCPNLEALILRNAETICNLASSTTFDASGISKATGYIYVPAALVDAYKAATNWSSYASQIRAIEDYPDITGG